MTALWPLAAPGLRYVVTPDDVLWLRRAVQAEGEPRAEVARALVRLHALTRMRGSTRTLAELVRAYAQPLNVAWFHGGPRDADPLIETPVERRRRTVHSTRVDFDAGTIAAVDAALSPGPHDGDVTDYARYDVDARGKGYVLRMQGRPGVNSLWTRAPGFAGYAASLLDSTGEGSRMDLVARIRELSQRLPAREREQVEAALRMLARVGAGEFDLQAANTLEALYEAVAQRVAELGGGALDAAGNVVERVVVPAAGALSGLLVALAVVGLLYLVWEERNR